MIGKIKPIPVRLRGLDRDAFTGRRACYLGEVNALHPFARNIEASAASLRGHPEPLRKMLDALLNSGTRLH